MTRFWELCNQIGNSMPCLTTGFLYTEGTEEGFVSESSLGREQHTDKHIYLCIRMYMYACIICTYTHILPQYEQPDFAVRETDGLLSELLVPQKYEHVKLVICLQQDFQTILQNLNCNVLNNGLCIPIDKISIFCEPIAEVQLHPKLLTSIQSR